MDDPVSRRAHQVDIMWSNTNWRDRTSGMARLSSPRWIRRGLRPFRSKTSFLLKCYICAIKRMDNVTDCGTELGQEYIERGGKRMWKNKSVGDSQIFDCTLPDTWRPSRLAKERSAMIALLERRVPTDERGWLNLEWRLPAGLRSALIKKLAAGNWIVSIADTGWPHPGSVVVTMRERSHATRRAPHSY